ncbi:hypothetical protein GCM10020358_59900 [Amorphoplanes nipponensis]|uniref:Uncharacterized protein n=1 Tax=Actinoplanes nipponensis TaxID=135950 RepID=A0A919MM22_9ACTN|nr:hypothetical protein [Actinoplanes nipponensis]GIE46968.1 hypothetical protein Ani05nite_05020 [Actinoplanes nipponensis]
MWTNWRRPSGFPVTSAAVPGQPGGGRVGDLGDIGVHFWLRFGEPDWLPEIVERFGLTR